MKKLTSESPLLLIVERINDLIDGIENDRKVLDSFRHVEESYIVNVPNSEINGKTVIIPTSGYYNIATTITKGEIRVYINDSKKINAKKVLKSTDKTWDNRLLLAGDTVVFVSAGINTEATVLVELVGSLVGAISDQRDIIDNALTSMKEKNAELLILQNNLKTELDRIKAIGANIEAVNAKTLEEVQKVIDEDKRVVERMYGVTHNIDNGKSLIKSSRKLYRTIFEIRSGEPFVSNIEVGDVATNDVIKYTIKNTSNKVRLYFKIQGTAEGNVLVTTDDNKYKLVIPVSNRTRHVSYEFTFGAGDSRVVNILGFVAYGQEIKVWDYDERSVI